MSLITGTGTAGFKCGGEVLFSAEASVFDNVGRQIKSSRVYKQQLILAQEFAHYGTDITEGLIVHKHPCGQIGGKDKTAESAEIASSLEEFQWVLTPVEQGEGGHDA